MRAKRSASKPASKANGTGASARPLVPDRPDEMIVRMYRQGLGDCFLLAFPAARNKTKYVVLDCGVHMRQTEGTARMAQVMAHLKASTGSHVDLVVATHEHADHLSGFVQKGSPFLEDDLTIGGAWLAWTERRGDGQADALRKKRGTAQRLIDKAVEKAQKAAGPGAGAIVDRLSELTGFSTPANGSVDPDLVKQKIASLGGEVVRAAAADPAVGPGATGKKTKSEDPTSNELALGLLVAKAGKDRTAYCEPGTVREVEGVSNLRAYVLGPPRSELLEKDKPSKIRGGTEGADGIYKEVYLTVSKPNRCLETSPGLEDEARREEAKFDDKRYPFPLRYRRTCDLSDLDRVEKRGPWDDLQRPPQETRAFIQDAYLDKPGDWRRIDGDWLASAEQLALNLAADTNNTSLVLAFEWGAAGKGAVLLFAADAQVGNWLSWRDQPYGDGAQTADKILSRVMLYKVGHHGSHNATVRRDPRDVAGDPLGARFGLELMDDIIAMIPVDWDAAQKKAPDPWQMPYEPLYRKLREKARGRVLRADERTDPLDAQREGADSTPTDTKWQPVPGLKGARWRRSEETFDAGTAGPLYYDVAIRLPG